MSKTPIEQSQSPDAIQNVINISITCNLVTAQHVEELLGSFAEAVHQLNLAIDETHANAQDADFIDMTVHVKRTITRVTHVGPIDPY